MIRSVTFNTETRRFPGKEPWQAGLSKCLEAYESGAIAGDMEYAVSNLYQYVNCAIIGCGDNLKTMSQKTQSYAKRAFQCQQQNGWKCLVILHQLTLDLMGLELNSFSPYSNDMTEQSCFTSCHVNNEFTICRLIANKKKYVAFFTGNMDLAAEMCEVGKGFPQGSSGRLLSALVGTFIDGLIGFFFARKHHEDETKWTDIGLDALQSLRKWAESSEWNFANKVYLLEAEYYFLRKDHDRAMVCYSASVRAAREHRFVHEEGLAEEKTATYLLHKGQHEDAMGHFLNAKKCFDAWGARTLVQRVDKAISVLLPLCSNTSHLAAITGLSL